jgi:CHAT domain-containing protein
MEALQLAELDNFLREACLAPKRQLDRVVDEDAPKTAVIYSIILPDRIEVILKLPQQARLYRYATAIEQAQVEQTLDELRRNLIEPYTYTLQIAKSLAQTVYSWLIQPAESLLAQYEIDTLVFVSDGALRNVPMAALYDGQHYLVERYAIALSSGLQLVEPQPFEQRGVEVLAAGLSEARHNLQPLQYVEQELEEIQADVSSQILLNQQFTTQFLQSQINSKPFSIVHLATHGQFDSDPDQTYIAAWDQLINVNELDNFLRTRDLSQANALELLVLSACQTAEGDRYAVLGLAGIAVRAGARSTLASLWNLEDESTAELMNYFYQSLLQPGQTRSEALRQAQLALLHNPQYQHPRSWAPYVLIGSWL